MSTTVPVCDLLIVVFTPGVSLQEWKDIGLLSRECALYERLSASVGNILFATWGYLEQEKRIHRLNKTLDGNNSVNI